MEESTLAEQEHPTPTKKSNTCTSGYFVVEFFGLNPTDIRVRPMHFINSREVF